jgi:hypothetical protein
MNESTSFIGGFLGFIMGLIIFAITYAFFAALFGLLISFLLRMNFLRIPAEHRKMDPDKLWYGAIPFYNAYLFFQFTDALSNSYKSYFDSVGDTSVGDCGKQIGNWFCIAFAVSYIFIIPTLNCLGPVVSLALLILLIIYLVKIFELRNKIPETPGGGAGPAPGSGDTGSTPGSGGAGGSSADAGPGSSPTQSQGQDPAPGTGPSSGSGSSSSSSSSTENPPGYRPS